MNTTQHKTIVLVGNPNVGKSTLFYRLTGTHVVTANYPGTTLAVTRGSLMVKTPSHTIHYTLIDTPGINSRDDASESLCSLIKTADIIFHVLNETQLKRGLLLNLQLRELTIPIVTVSNMHDEALYHGISVNHALLSEHIESPVLATSASTGSGLTPLISLLKTPPLFEKKLHIPATWERATAIVNAVQTKELRHKQWQEYFASWSVNPITGSIIALIVFTLTLTTVFGISSLLESSIKNLFMLLNSPLVALHHALENYPLIQNIVVGSLFDGRIDPEQSLGIVTSGIFIPLGQVAPPVIGFYAVMGLLEDSGYLPRIALVADTLLHRYALHGVALVPMLLGAGCNVTGIIGTRVLAHRQQRIIAATLIALIVPCASQTGFLLAMISDMGSMRFAALLIVLAAIYHGVGILLGRTRTKNFQELIIEIPPLRVPRIAIWSRKLVHRIKNFLSDAIPITMLGIALLLFLTYSDILACLSTPFSLITTALWGLPASITPALCMGLFRKEIALSYLKSLAILTPNQAFTATLILTLWFPCVSVYAILYKEFGGRSLLCMTGLMLAVSTLAGVASHLAWTLFS